LIKDAYINEITLAETQGNGTKNASVKRIQEWLCLNALYFPAAPVVVVIDGQFGPATERAVKNLQRAMKLDPTGEVTPAFFERMVAPMRTAFAPVTAGGNLRDRLLSVAKRHLVQRASELQTGAGQNLGPWVRAYCDGHDGSPFLWCMGFSGETHTLPNPAICFCFALPTPSTGFIRASSPMLTMKCSRPSRATPTSRHRATARRFSHGFATSAKP
jgi:hypothetical protein